MITLTGHLLLTFTQKSCHLSPVSALLILKGEIQPWKQSWVNHSHPPTTASEAYNLCSSNFCTTKILLQILLTAPVSAASAERSFSCLRRLKTWLRSTITQDRLTGLALMSINRHIDIDIDTILNIFANSDRRLLFQL